MLCAHELSAQTLHSNGGTIYINNGGVLYCNGGIELTNNSALTNNGDLTTTKLSTFSIPGNYEILSSSTSSGDGNYHVEQNWVNDAQFNGGQSSVVLYGNTEQLITSSNGTVTVFNDLILNGTGLNVDRRKTLMNVDAKVSSSGQLILNDRELYTMANSMYVDNTFTGAVTNDQTFDDEGFVSSDPNGYLIWSTSSTGSYVFPVGSSVDVRRYRPVRISPTSNSSSVYSVRMNNVLADLHGYPLAQKQPSLEMLNSNFYHSIDRTVGSSDAEIAIAFEPTSDGLWKSIGHWHNSNQLWNEIFSTTEGTIGQYSSLEKSDWNFDENSTHYVLAKDVDEFLIPNVFTPNEDGANDMYFITATGLEEFNLTILNRWGQTMYESDDVNAGWDGNFNGNPCPDGTYFYIIKAKNLQGDIVKQGHITLNRSN